MLSCFYVQLQGASKKTSHGESAEPFPPELRSDIVTKFLRIGSTIRRNFVWTDEKYSRRSPHDEFLEMPYSK